MVNLPYGRSFLPFDTDKYHPKNIIKSPLNSYSPSLSEEETVLKALENPVNSPRLSKLAEGKKKVVIIASDHTRPVPSRLIIPPMLSEIRKGNPDADITILIATGCHRQTKKEELISKFGKEIYEREKIVIHDCDDEENLVSLGLLPSGGELIISRLAAECDLLVSEGFTEPHFFAGFSGGRKSVLPGIASRKTVLSNHCSEFIASPFAKTGVLENNPVHKDMDYAAEKAGLAFIVNVVINSEKKVIGAFSGHFRDAHAESCRFLSSLCGVPAESADIVVATNGGYPLDQNVYQAVKGMTAAESIVREGGVIIMLSEAADGIGGEKFFSQMSEDDIGKVLDTFMKRGRGETEPDQWQSQIFIRVLMKASVIFISSRDDETVRKLHMIPAHSIDEAMEKAGKILNKENPDIVLIPDGVSVIVRQE